MTDIIRVRDIMHRQQEAQQQQPSHAEEARVQRLAENARKHLAEQTDKNSWQNRQKYEAHLINMHDATPIELLDVADLLETAYFSQEDRESGVAPKLALSMVRGRL